jgi:glycosyltransferase involved in cell wall biosynthesis
MNSIAIILPAYNEELTIAGTIRSFASELPHAEIIVVDNNSSDNTSEIAKKTFQEMELDGKIVYEAKQGKGNAVRRAFLEVDADVVVMADADMTYPANQVHQLILPILDGRADMTVGDRHTSGNYIKENKRNFHNFGNWFVKTLVNKLFAANLADIMSGYRAFSRSFVKNYPILVEGFQLETDITLHALDKRFRIIEIPVEYQDRPEGSISKLNTFSDGTKVLFTIAQILRYYRPMLFFGGISFILFLLGLFAGYPAIVDWIVHSYVYHVPLAVLAAALEISAIMSLGIGLILDSINHQHRLQYEKELL